MQCLDMFIFLILQCTFSDSPVARKKPTKVVNIFDNCKFIVNKCYINLTFAYLSYNFGLFGEFRLAVQRNAQGVGCGKEKKE